MGLLEMVGLKKLQPEVEDPTWLKEEVFPWIDGLGKTPISKRDLRDTAQAQAQIGNNMSSVKIAVEKCIKQAEASGSQ